ncbi:MAG: hypothetical protein PHZ02_14210 [Desulfocapsaceae bacterium]|nr:hypothetical protein [Desulfocapsaceae bacterium]
MNEAAACILSAAVAASSNKGIKSDGKKPPRLMPAVRQPTMKKEIVILAKSVKFRQYCIAGREIIRSKSGLSLGEWIRPVNDREDEALSYGEIRFINHAIPKLLDIVEISLSEKTGSTTQPENWRINKNIAWAKTGHISKKSLTHFVEAPEGLWIDSFAATDRISSQSFANQSSSSLCIIKPNNFQMKIYTDFDAFAGREKKRRRGIFDYNGQHYNLAITDPDIDTKYFRPFPKIDEDAKNIIPSNDCLLCISLAPEFHGYHYKLIATVIEHE